MMEKTIYILFLCLLSSIFNIQAQNDSIPEYQLSEIVVLADRLPEVDIISVYEIKQRDIQRMYVKNAQEALLFVPGLYFTRSTKNEMTFRIRGFQQRQVNVFLDGIPISFPYDGLVDVSQLTGDTFENIRISKGASSVLYGANTLGGSINIITALPEKHFTHKWRVEGSDQGKFFTNLLLSGSIHRLRYVASVTLDNAPEFTLPGDVPPMPNQTGEKRNNSSYRKQSANLKLQYMLNSTHRIGAHLNFTDNRLGVPPNALEERPRYWKFPEWRKNVFSLNTEHIFNNQFLLRSIWFHDTYRNVLESYDDETYTTQNARYAFTSIYNDYSQGGILYPQFNWSPHNITRGIISFKNDVHREKQGLSEPYSRYAIGMLTIGVENEMSFFEQGKVLIGLDGNYLKPLKAEDLALRDPIFLINGQATLRYHHPTNLEIHGTIGSKSRFPTLRELYSERLGRNIPNPDLQYERSLNTELGLRWNHLAGYLEASYFYHYLSDLIVNVQVGNGLQQYQNFGKVLSYGFEVDAGRSWNSLDVRANYTFLHTRNQTEVRSSPYLEYRPTHQLNGRLYYAPVSHLMLGIETAYFADQYYQNPDQLSWEKLNNYGLLNLSGEYNLLRFITAYIRMNNLLDTFYYSEYGVPMPGRELFIGIKIDG
jgi:iron complex outermembrane receptor protein